MALAGAMVLIMAMALSFTNYLISEQIPSKLFDWVTSIGITKRWHFLLALNLFMWIMGAVMEGFSAIFVAVPLIIPFGAQFRLSPFHLAMMFLLNLEIAFLSPPFGQNLFVASFRFRKPMASLYRIALPFLGILTVGLLIIMYVPKLSTVVVEKDIAAAKAKAARFNDPPREAWLLECVQDDRNNPLPCTDAEREHWKIGETKSRSPTVANANGQPPPAAADSQADEVDDIANTLIAAEDARRAGIAKGATAETAPAPDATAQAADNVNVQIDRAAQTEQDAPVGSDVRPARGTHAQAKDRLHKVAPPTSRVKPKR
jgi:hypothetical protein